MKYLHDEQELCIIGSEIELVEAIDFTRIAQLSNLKLVLSPARQALGSAPSALARQLAVVPRTAQQWVATSLNRVSDLPPPHFPDLGTAL